MWRIEEHRRVDKQISAAPREILKRYEKWKDIVMLSGRRPSSDRGFNDEPCPGSGMAIGPHDSGAVPSFLPYGAGEQLFQVVSITAHDYRRP